MNHEVALQPASCRVRGVETLTKFNTGGLDFWVPQSLPDKNSPLIELFSTKLEGEELFSFLGSGEDNLKDDDVFLKDVRDLITWTYNCFSLGPYYPSLSHLSLYL